MLNRAALMLFTLLSKIGFVRGLRGGVGSEVLEFVSDSDARLKLAAHLTNAKKSCRVVVVRRLSVLVVQCARGRAQIDKSVVVFDPIDVVNQLGGKIPMHVQPCEPVRQVTAPLDPDAGVVIGGNWGAGDAALFPNAGGVYTPSEKASFGAILQNASQKFCGKIGRSHDAPYQQIGQRPGRVRALPGFAILAA